jgi:hypothetical protein
MILTVSMWRREDMAVVALGHQGTRPNHIVQNALNSIDLTTVLSGDVASCMES